MEDGGRDQMTQYIGHAQGKKYMYIRLETPATNDSLQANNIKQ